jgi:hypothetical protein
VDLRGFRTQTRLSERVRVLLPSHPRLLCLVIVSNGSAFTFEVSAKWHTRVVLECLFSIRALDLVGCGTLLYAQDFVWVDGGIEVIG